MLFFVIRSVLVSPTCSRKQVYLLLVALRPVSCRDSDDGRTHHTGRESFMGFPPLPRGGVVSWWLWRRQEVEHRLDGGYVFWWILAIEVALLFFLLSPYVVFLKRWSACFAAWIARYFGEYLRRTSIGIMGAACNPASPPPYPPPFYAACMPACFLSRMRSFATMCCKLIPVDRAVKLGNESERRTLWKGAGVIPSLVVFLWRMLGVRSVGINRCFYLEHGFFDGKPGAKRARGRGPHRWTMPDWCCVFSLVTTQFVMKHSSTGRFHPWGGRVDLDHGMGEGGMGGGGRVSSLSATR